MRPPTNRLGAALFLAAALGIAPGPLQAGFAPRTRDKERARQSNAAYMRRAREANPEKFRARERKASLRRQFPERVRARQLLNAAVRRGEVAKPDRCTACGLEKRLTAHHDDYSKPLDVRWLCYACHGKEHRVVTFERVEAAPEVRS